MATAATSLLGLALPVTGELSGTWGDTVNVSITALLDTAIAGTTTLSSDADVTLTTTTLAANQARQAIILWTAGGTATRTITVPAQSKSYIVINKTSSSQSIKIVGVGPTTGVTIVAGTAAFVVWNGVDFVTASVTSTTGVLPVANGGTGVTTSTGTTNVVLSNSPTLVTPALGAATGTSLALTGLATVGTTLGVTGVSTLTAGAVIQGLTAGRGAGAVSTNTAVGASALAANTTGTANTAIGYVAGVFTTGTDNTALGYGAYVATTGSNNTGVGSSALIANTSGSLNTAIGQGALSANISGAENTAVGAGALVNNTGSYNSALGRFALANNTTASNNTAVGYQAGFSNTTGVNIVAIGHQVLYSNTTGANNIGVGSRVDGFANSTLYNNTTGTQNNAFGSSALVSNTTGNENNAFGYLTLLSNTTGVNNTAYGNRALQSNTTASNNTAVGYQAMYSNTTASNSVAYGYKSLYSQNSATNVNNTSIGYEAMYLNTTGTNNTALGYATLNANTSGGYNTALGMFALGSNTTASNNTAVGYQAGYTNTSGGNNTNIGYQAGYTNPSSGTNVFVGYQAGYAFNAVGQNSANAFIGYGAGSSVTSGLKNTILGSYSGNQGGLDIRTASNYIVLSDGDGNPKLISPGSNNWALGVPVAGTVWRDASPTLILQYGGLRSERYTAGNVQVKLTNNVYEDTTTGYYYITSDPGSMYIQINGVHKWECAPSGTAGDAVTFTQVLAAEKDKSVALQGAVPQSGAGITFPATQSASTNANTLDDYEEGTWTPAIGGNAGGTSTLSVAYGDYIKVGRQVTVKGRIEFSASTLSGGGIYMSGLPFTANSTTSSNSVGTLLAENIVYLGQIYSFINPNATFLYFLTGATSTIASALGGGAFGSTSIATFSITYFV